MKAWLYKYKLYHIPFWCLYQYIWWVIAIGNPFAAANAIFLSVLIVKFGFYVVFQALAVYFNLYYLIPKYLEKSRFIPYLIYFTATVFCAACIIVFGYYIIAYLSGTTVQKLFGADTCYHLFFATAFPSTIASMTLAMSIKLTKNWISTSRKQQLLEKEKLETELQFLKNQFNPHFLFNSINSIFFLIHKNPDMASASLAKFSDLLRYQLYECNDHQIPLGKEIAYMENFIELEKLRQNKNFTIDVLADSAGQGPWGIAPFILMTFVENAFKHVSKSTDRPNWIHITLAVSEGQLEFHVSNSTSMEADTQVIKYSGIGLNNVQRRLDLMYADAYELDIKDTGHRFEVRLRLRLSELVLPAEPYIATGGSAPLQMA